MPNRVIINDNPQNLAIQIYGTDPTQPILVDDGGLVVSGTVNIDTIAPLSVNVVEITPINITGIVSVTVTGTPTVNILPTIVAVSTTTLITTGIITQDIIGYDVSSYDQYNFYLYGNVGTTIKAQLYNSPVPIDDGSALIYVASAQNQTELSITNSFNSQYQVAVLSSNYLANSAFIRFEAPSGQTITCQFITK